MKKIRNVTFIVLVCLSLGFLGFIYLSNPIVINGTSIYKDANGNDEIVFDVNNEGINKLRIKEVLINNQPNNQLIDLGISYDTLQIVQSNTDNELIKFYALDEKSVLPQKTSDEVAAALTQKEMTPLHYGIRVNNFKEPIESITIKYKYFGLSVSKEIKVHHLIPSDY